MSQHVKFNDDFKLSDSDDDYGEAEKELLKKVRGKKKEYSDSEDEVFGVAASESEEDQSDIALSDVEGQEDDDDLPDERAWGKDKRKFYSTDYVDADYGGFQGKDAHLAELEEEEARNLQKQLAQQLDDDDFALNLFSKKPSEGVKEAEEIVVTDISKLSKRQQLELLKKESPEFFSLVEDFKDKMELATKYLSPVLEKYKKGEIPTSPAIEFVQTQFELILNYSTNIFMYLLLKSSKVSIQNHPVIKRLYQFRQLLSQLQPVFDEKIKPQIEDLLNPVEVVMEDVPIQEEKAPIKKKTKKMNLLNKLQENKELAAEASKKKMKKIVTFEEPELPSKKAKLEQIEELLQESDEEVLQDNDEEMQEENDGEIGKRAITYQMKKNKGLTPHRKKELRNPRVKHKERYRKAVIRRKGAVRQPRKELTKYSGEISGIKTSVVKSIKIKT